MRAHVCTYARPRVCACVCTHVRVHACAYVGRSVHVCTHVRARVRMHMPANVESVNEVVGLDVLNPVALYATKHDHRR